ncbi:hypothetical protein ACH3XX_09595 [Streptomyces scabiei]|uniref:hypothetical protein n=1 Tax=Streptomyces scabiei TaxID=1930 RepID=UPI00379E2D24
MIATRRQCPRLLPEARCGLWHGHDGDHTPHQIGAYFPPPLISPLDILRLIFTAEAGHWRALRCPLCGHRPHPGFFGDSFGFSVEDEGLVLRVLDGEERLTEETLWRFWPCGCEGRELINPTPESRSNR